MTNPISRSLQITIHFLISWPPVPVLRSAKIGEPQFTQLSFSCRKWPVTKCYCFALGQSDLATTVTASLCTCSALGIASDDKVLERRVFTSIHSSVCSFEQIYREQVIFYVLDVQVRYFDLRLRSHSYYILPKLFFSVLAPSRSSFHLRQNVGCNDTVFFSNLCEFENWSVVNCEGILTRQKIWHHSSRLFLSRKSAVRRFFKCRCLFFHSQSSVLC